MRGHLKKERKTGIMRKYLRIVNISHETVLNLKGGEHRGKVKQLKRLIKNCVLW